MLVPLALPVTNQAVIESRSEVGYREKNCDEQEISSYELHGDFQ